MVNGETAMAKRKGKQTPNRMDVSSRPAEPENVEADKEHLAKNKRPKLRDWTESAVCKHLQDGGAPGDLGVLQLKEYLRNEGLRQNGSKQELIRRIEEHLNPQKEEGKGGKDRLKVEADEVRVGPRKLSDAEVLKNLEDGCAPDDYNVAQLKAFLRTKCLRENGNKKELIERIYQHLKGDDEDDEELEDEEEEEQYLPGKLVMRKDLSESAVCKHLQDGGAPEELSLPQIRCYIKSKGLRVSSSKHEIIDRLKMYLRLSSVGAQAVYPEASFTIDVRATGDIVMGDTLLFEQAIFPPYNWMDPGDQPEPIGERKVAAHVVKEGYGMDKQQHTFTMEILWTSGIRPLGLMTQLLVKGRNLFNTKTLRQAWPDENNRKEVQAEKMGRASEARVKKYGDADVKDIDDSPGKSGAVKKPVRQCVRGACKKQKAKDCASRMCARCCKDKKCMVHGTEYSPEYDSDEEKYVRGNGYCN